MAAAWFNRLVNPQLARAVSAGTRPANRVHPEVLAVMQEVGIDLTSATTQRLTAEVAKDAYYLITMGCDDECPVVPGAKRTDWPLDDPSGQPLEKVRAIRDDIRHRVVSMIRDEGWN
jgi:arsenate reductase